MAILIGSDLHFKDSNDPVFLGFVQLLKEKSTELDRVILAGDIFDFFVGCSPYLIRKFQQFFDVLEQLNELGVKIDYIEGNHDFQLQGLFDNYKNVTLHSDELVIDRDGFRIYVAHGDLVDPDDKAYLRMRKFFRSPFARALTKVIPGQSYDLLKRGFDRVNPTRENFDENAIADVRLKFREFAKSKFQQGFHFVVLGHCHDLDGFEETQDGELYQYLNMGFPPRDKSVLIWDHDQSKFKRHLFIR